MGRKATSTAQKAEVRSPTAKAWNIPEFLFESWVTFLPPHKPLLDGRNASYPLGLAAFRGGCEYPSLAGRGRRDFRFGYGWRRVGLLRLAFLLVQIMRQALL